MPGVERISIDLLPSAVLDARSLGLAAVALFPVTDPTLKTDRGDEALNPRNLVCRAVREIRDSGSDIGVICDVALDPYTSHGHDGVWIEGVVDNDLTIEILCKQALVQAEAGCDIVAPSDMMDGRVGAIRDALDAKGYNNVGILSYAAKYASSFYGPFRDAVGSASALGSSDKRTYQMDPANRREALREARQDVLEGADILLVKPALPYLDVLRDICEEVDVPVFAYQVSGEYSMMKAAAERGLLHWESALLESLIAIRRAGATGIMTYAACEAARLL